MKLTSIRVLPKDEGLYSFDEKQKIANAEFDSDFSDSGGTKLTTDAAEKDQIEKFLKRLLYSKRKSAVRFYQEADHIGNVDFSRERY